MSHRAGLSKPSAILIAGPTASGKSALAVEVAKAVHGIVINADSMQVYQDLHILSARPDKYEMAGVPHRLYGHVDGAVNYSVGHYLVDLSAELSLARENGLVPVIVGGTGLYFKAMTEGLSPMPLVPDSVRLATRRSLEGKSAAELHDMLHQRDTLMAARLRPTDPQRITRALEVLEATGISLATWQDKPRSPPLIDLGTSRAIFLDVPRDWVLERIDRRFDLMMEAGAMDEIKALHARHLAPDLPVMRAHGVPGLISYLGGGMTLEDAIEKGKRDTRAYAKRQVTWFRNQCAGFEFLNPTDARQALDAWAK